MNALARTSNVALRFALPALFALPGMRGAQLVLLLALPCAALPPQSLKPSDKAQVLSASEQKTADGTEPLAGTHSASPEEKLLFDSANRERVARQLPPVEWDAALAQAARQHAQLMAAQHRFAHQLPGELSLSRRAGEAGAHFARVAENIAIATDAEEIHDGWMDSPGHRANILDARYTALGVGVIENNGKLYAVEDFSTAVASLALKAQEETVTAQLAKQGVRVVSEREVARGVCQGEWKRLGPGEMYVMHYEVSDLSELPEQVVRAIRGHHYGRAAVGACAPKESSAGFARFRIAVVLY